MERISVIAALMLLTSSASADWYGDWWNNVYHQRIEREQYDKIRSEEEDRCAAKLRWYKERVEKKPNSEYYQYKLEKWRNKCGVE